MKKILCALLCAVLAFSVIGCSTQNDPILGEWQYADEIATFMESTGIEVDDPALLFEEDGNVTMRSNGAESIGTYTIDDELIYIIDNASVDMGTYELAKDDSGKYSLYLDGIQMFVKK